MILEINIIKLIIGRMSSQLNNSIGDIVPLIKRRRRASSPIIIRGLVFILGILFFNLIRLGELSDRGYRSQR